MVFFAHVYPATDMIGEEPRVRACRRDGEAFVSAPGGCTSPVAATGSHEEDFGATEDQVCCGSGPRANLARGGYKASLSTPPRILKQSSATLSHFRRTRISFFRCLQQVPLYLSFSFSFSTFKSHDLI